MDVTTTQVFGGIGGFFCLVLLWLHGYWRGIETQKRRPHVITNAVSLVRSNWLTAQAEVIEFADNAEAEFDRIKAEAWRETEEKIATLRARVSARLAKK